MDPRKRTRPKPEIVDTGLFIGGVADGRRQMIDMSLNAVRLSPPALPTSKLAIYERELIAGETSVFAFWRDKTLSIDEALKCLFERYKGANRDG